MEFQNCGINTILVQKDEVLQDDQEVAKEFDTSLNNTDSALVINKSCCIINHNSKNIVDPLDRAKEMYKYHTSIILIKERVDIQNKFPLGAKSQKMLN